MKASSVVLCAIVALALVSLAHGLGTIYINKIRGNDDQLSVNIENVNFQANRVKLDRIFGLNSPGGKSEGTYIEDSQLVRGSFFIPRNLLVEKVATISGRLNFNGGLDADAVPLAGTSFKVADDSGITTVLGVTNPNGGIDVRKGAFVVENDTGRTTVAGLLRPNGDTLVKNTLFKVSAKDGSVTTLGEVDAQLDVILGTSVAESRYLTRVPSTSTANPGATGGERKLIIQGQNAINQGGNLVLEPGYSYGEHTPLSPGRVLLGRAAADSLLITRGAVAAAGGLTTFAAQSSSSHRGGDLIFSAGRSTAAAQTPANLLLQVGQNPISSLNGVIELGTSTGHDLNVRRVVLTSAINGKTTFLRGQAVSAPGAGGSGGKIVLRAGNAFTDKVPGNIVLAPGSATPGSRHRIRIGDSVPNADASWSTVTRGTDLWVTRDPVRSDAGQAPALTGASRTNFQGQHSLQGTGGSISFRAGDSALLRLDLAVFNGADLYLTNGKDSGPAPAARNLYWGRDTQDLNIRRYVNPKAAGTSTTIRGQIVTNVGAALRGGDFFLTSGTGATRSGDLLFRAPDSADTDLGLGGTISISTGSSVYLSAGGDSAGKVPNGGSVYIQAGTGVTAGDIELAAVTGTAIQTIAATDNQRVPNAAANQQSFTQTGVVAGTATFTGVVAVLGSSAFSLEEVDFQVTQTDSLTPSPIFSIHRTANAANRVFTNTPATNVNALNRPCNYRTAVADTGCTTVPALAAPVFPAPAVGDFYLQTTVPISTPTAFAATYTTVSAGNIANERIAPTTIGTAYPYHHVFRYTLIGGAPGTFDSILAPRYDGIAMQMNDQITANVYHLNALPRFSVLSPAIWRFTAWDPPVALANTQNVYATPTPDFQDTIGTDNAGIRVPPYNIRQNGGGARLTGFTDNAQPEGLGNIALGSLYSKSKTDRGFRGVIFDIAQNLNRVICALHNLGFIQAREVAWGGPAANNPVPGLIPIDQRCDPTPLRLLRYLNNNVAFYSPKFVAPVYTA